MCIPARFGSSRLPGKPLLDFGGKPMICRVVENVLKAQGIHGVYVLTDSEKIKHALEGEPCIVLMTSELCDSGTSRIVSVLEKMEGDLIINVQGDEPFLPPEHLEAIIDLMKNEDVEIGTLCHRIDSYDSLFDYNRVKVVFDVNHKALYFSRQAIPGKREQPYRKWMEDTTYYQHIGIYGYRRASLEKIRSMPILSLERAESLEQLNWLENGMSVYVKCVDKLLNISIDTEDDYRKAISWIKRQGFFDR